MEYNTSSIPNEPSLITEGKLEINTMIGTSGKYHGEVWRFRGEAGGWESVYRTNYYNTRQEVLDEALNFKYEKK